VLVVEAVVALDQALDLGDLGPSDRRPRAERQPRQPVGGREHPYSHIVVAAGDLRVRVVEQDDRLRAHGLPGPGQEPREEPGRLGELNLRGTAPVAAVFDHSPAHRVAVPVELDVAPPAPADSERPVDVLDLDREQAAGAEQEVVDLAAPVPVSLDEHPGVVQPAAEQVRDFPLAPDAAFEGALVVGRRRPGRGSGRRAGREPAGPQEGGQSPAQPREQPALCPGLVAALARLADVPLAGRQVPPVTLVRARARGLTGLGQHVAGVIGQHD